MNGPLGMYGKIPLKADFVARNLSDAVIQRLDDWLHESIEQLVAIEGRSADAIVDGLTAWRFALPPGPLDRDAWCGVVTGSRDRVGRRFPVVLLARAPVDCPPAQVLAHDDWFQHLEDTWRDAIDGRVQEFDSWWARAEGFSDASNRARVTHGSGLLGDSSPAGPTGYSRLSTQLMEFTPAPCSQLVLDAALRDGIVPANAAIWFQNGSAQNHPSRVLIGTGALDFTLFKALATPQPASRSRRSEAPALPAAARVSARIAQAPAALALNALDAFAGQDYVGVDLVDGSLASPFEPSIDDLWSDEDMAPAGLIEPLTVAVVQSDAEAPEEFDDIPPPAPLIIGAASEREPPLEVLVDQDPNAAADGLAAPRCRVPCEGPMTWTAHEFMYRRSIGSMQDDVADGWLAVFAADMPVVYTLFDSLHRLLGQTASAASVDAQFVNQTGCNPADLMTAMCHCVDDQVAAIMAEQASLLRGADLNLVVLAVKDRHLFVIGKGEFLVVEAGQRSPLAQGISAQSELPADPLADLGDFSDLFDEVASESADFLSTAAADAEPKGLPSPPAASSITLLTDAGCYLVFLPCVGESWALSAVDWSLTRPVAGEVSSLCRMVEQLVDPVHVEGGWVIESIPLHGAGTGVASDSPSADGSDWLGDGL